MIDVAPPLQMVGDDAEPTGILPTVTVVDGRVGETHTAGVFQVITTCPFPALLPAVLA